MRKQKAEKRKKFVLRVVDTTMHWQALTFRVLKGCTHVERHSESEDLYLYENNITGLAMALCIFLSNIWGLSEGILYSEANRALVAGHGQTSSWCLPAHSDTICGLKRWRAATPGGPMPALCWIPQKVTKLQGRWTSERGRENTDVQDCKKRCWTNERVGDSIEWASEIRPTNEARSKWVKTERVEEAQNVTSNQQVNEKKKKRVADWGNGPLQLLHNKQSEVGWGSEKKKKMQITSLLAFLFQKQLRRKQLDTHMKSLEVFCK